QAAAAVHAALSAESNQANRLDLAWLDTDGGAGGQIEAHAIGGSAIEDQRSVHLEKVEVRADLDRPIAGVVHFQRDGGPARIQLNRRIIEQIFARNHGCFLSGDGFVNGDQLGAVGKSRL